MAEVAKSPEEVQRQAITAQNQQAATAENQQTTQVVSDDQTFTAFAKALAQVSPTIRIKIAQQLKAAGLYRGTPTGEFNNAFYDALLKAEEKREQLARVTTVPSRYDFIASLGTQGTTETGATARAKKPSTVVAGRVDDNTTAEARVTKAFEALGIEPTPQQITEWRKKLQAAQKKNPVTTKYTTKNGVQTSTTSGGLDDDFWLAENLSKAFKTTIEANKLKNPAIEKRLASKRIYDQVTKGLTGNALDDAAVRTEYGSGLKDTLNRVKEYALEAGAIISDEQAMSLAQELYDNAQENDVATIRSMLRSKITVGEGVLGGRAGTNLTELKKVAAANGLDLTKSFGGQVQNWLQNIEAGESVETYKQIIRNVAKLGLPDKVSALLDQGVDLETVYTPYRRQMAALLEVDEDAIKLDDPLLRSAIGPDKEMSIFDFKKTIRKDPRWQYTDNAREDVSNVALQVLRDFGFQG